VRDTTQVDNDRLDSITLAFDFGLNAFHLVTIERVGDIATNIDSTSHDCGLTVVQGKTLLKATVTLELTAGISSMKQISYIPF
jgi:hypothetical protein